MVFEKVKEILNEYIDLNIDDITLQTRLIEDLGINSYEFMGIIGEIEDAFDFEVDEKAVLNIITIEDLLDYISNFKEEKGRLLAQPAPLEGGQTGRDHPQMHYDCRHHHLPGLGQHADQRARHPARQK